MYILGVDAGGTKTECILVDSAFELVGTGQSGPGNYNVAGEDGAKRNIEAAIADALVPEATAGDEAVVAGLGVGNLDTEADRAVIAGFLDDIEHLDETYLVNDVALAHYATTGGRAGVVVVAGTGAMAYGRDERGETARASGWGWLLGDEGSGFDAARRGLQAATRAEDGRGEPTVLTEEAVDHFDLDSLESLFSRVYEDLDHPKEIATFAEPVAEAAAEGDAAASRIARDAARELAIAAVAVDDALRITPPTPVGCVGSFGTSGAVFPRFADEIRDRFADADVLDPVDNPVVGAVALVAERTDAELEAGTLRRLDEAVADEAR